MSEPDELPPASETDAGHRKSGEREVPSADTGCLLLLFGFSWFFVLNDIAVVDALQLCSKGFPRAGIVVGYALPAVVVAWLIAFRFPLGRLPHLASLRAARRWPVLVRHGILWFAMFAVVAVFHWLTDYLLPSN